MENNHHNNPLLNKPEASGDDPSFQPNNLGNSRKVINPISTNLGSPVLGGQAQKPIPQNLPAPPINVQPPGPTPITPLPNTQNPTAIQSPQAPAQQGPENYLTGSQMKPEKKKLLVGVYVIAGYNLLGFIVGFFDSSQTGPIYTIALLISLLLAIGLMLRLDIARKLMIGLSAILIVLTTVSIILLAGLQSKIKESKANYESAVSRIDQNRLTSSQKQTLDNMSEVLAQQEKQVGNLIVLTYAKLGITALGSVIIIFYLRRPKVREAFDASPILTR